MVAFQQTGFAQILGMPGLRFQYGQKVKPSLSLWKGLDISHTWETPLNLGAGSKEKGAAPDLNILYNVFPQHIFISGRGCKCLTLPGKQHFWDGDSL